MAKRILRTILVDLGLLLATAAFGVGEYAMLHAVDNQTYGFIYFFLILVLYCNIVAKILVYWIKRSHDRT
jgi:hypothetical protein